MALTHKTVITEDINESFPLASIFLGSEVKNKDLMILTLLESAFTYFQSIGMNVPENTNEIRIMCKMIPHLINKTQVAQPTVVKNNQKPIKKAKRKNTYSDNLGTSKKEVLPSKSEEKKQSLIQEEQNQNNQESVSVPSTNIIPNIMPRLRDKPNFQANFGFMFDDDDDEDETQSSDLPEYPHDY